MAVEVELKILIVRLGSLGDIVHTIPAQQQIAAHLPHSEIHWVAEPPYQSLLRQVPGISRLWTADTKKWRRRYSTLREFPRLVAALKRERFDIALDFQGLLKSALLSRLTGARQVLGFPRQELKEPLAAWLYTDTILASNLEKGHQQRHVIELNIELARFLGCSDGASALIPLSVPVQKLHSLMEKLRMLGIGRPVVLNLGAGWPEKLWPARHYANLFLRIRKQLGLPVLFTYGPGEEPLLEEVRQIIKPLPVPTFSTDLLELAALCRQARLVVGTDTGPLHLAVALGTPTVALMGPTSASRNGPFQRNDPVVTGTAPSCVDIPVNEVFDAVLRRLKMTNDL